MIWFIGFVIVVAIALMVVEDFNSDPKWHPFYSKPPKGISDEESQP